jgi:hypothetical protein
MFSGGNRLHGRAVAALGACALAAVLTATGCGSGGGSGGGSSQPSWAKSLGSSVTIIAPGAATPGNTTPPGVMAGVVQSITVGPITDFCKYEQPSEQTQCKSTFGQVTKTEVASQLPTFKNFAVGYTAIDGTKALIGITGTVCVPNQKPHCYSNTNPAAILDSGKPFATLWSQAVAAPTNVYSLSPAIEVNGSWYAYTASS